MDPASAFRIAGATRAATARSYDDLIDEATTGALVLRTPTWQNLAWMTLCLALASPALLIHPAPAIVIAAAAFFALGAIVFALSCLPGAAYLRLTARGITVVNLFRRSTFAWDDVTSIGITTLQNRTIVGFDSRSVAERNPKLAALNVAMCGYRCVLNDSYGLPIQTLASLMIDARARALDRETI